MRDRRELPQLAGDTFITDGGMETTLIFHRGADLPEFASFVLLDDATGRRMLREYYRSYIEIARHRGVGVILDTPTWRASSDWGDRLGYSPAALAELNRRGVAMLQQLRTEAGDVPFVISGCLGPRGDGYRADDRISSEAAERYHRAQIATLAAAGADMITALTITYADEAVGIVRAAAGAEIPAVISFTVETDGHLPSGQALGDAIDEVDDATGAAAAYFMLNCAHPRHFAGVLDADKPWARRLRGLRANASTKSHAELDEAEELDEGDPHELADDYRALRSILPRLTVVGGCCGTDHRHVDAVCAAWSA